LVVKQVYFIFCPLRLLYYLNFTQNFSSLFNCYLS